MGKSETMGPYYRLPFDYYQKENVMKAGALAAMCNEYLMAVTQVSGGGEGWIPRGIWNAPDIWCWLGAARDLFERDRLEESMDAAIEHRLVEMKKHYGFPMIRSVTFNLKDDD